MAVGKKAMFISLGMLLIGLSVLALSGLMLSGSYQSSDAAAMASVYGRISLLSSSISQSLFELINESSGINVYLNTDSASFIEQLPNNNAPNFRIRLAAFKDFAEQDGHLSLNTLQTNNYLPLTLFPQNITYTHPSYGGSEINVIPNENNFAGYELRIDVGEEITNCVWSASSGTLNLTVYADGSSGTECEESRLIDTGDESALTVMTLNGDTTIKVINSILNVSTEPSITLNTTIRANSTSISLSEGTLTVLFPAFDYISSSRVTILK